ncbi:WD repeat-containing protein 55 [Protopterus annectens]|uniref:WD repeat-containing protein 55 n=1 Tax=Protopterus annectens TaxID=7888 RepID=UPI001CFAEF76|nr:WD repeat-containing protein 55 [Protopterus annectens]
MCNVSEEDKALKDVDFKEDCSDERERDPQRSCEDNEPEEPKEPRIRETPEDIAFEAIVNTIDFHPKEQIIAAGDVDGDVFVYSYSCVEGDNKELWSSGHHLKSCREVKFSHDGQRLFTVSKDKAVHILDVEKGMLLKRFSKAHSTSINCLLLIDENLFATGDDDGMLKVWDLRKEAAFMELKEHDDYISGIVIDQNKKILLTSSGDGTMGVFNIKRRRLDLVSEYQNGDLTSISLMKKCKKVVCGSSNGTLYIFNWNGFGAASDRFALKAESVDSVVPITENILCTASLDGVIRAINILPNRVVGVVGQHLGEPVEQIAKSHDGHFLASCGHDQKLKFWDISALSSLKVSDYKKKKIWKLQSLTKKAFGRDDFFADLVENSEKKVEKDTAVENEDSDSDSDDSD